MGSRHTALLLTARPPAEGRATATDGPGSFPGFVLPPGGRGLDPSELLEVKTQGHLFCRRFRKACRPLLQLLGVKGTVEGGRASPKSGQGTQAREPPPNSRPLSNSLPLLLNSSLPSPPCPPPPSFPSPSSPLSPSYPPSAPLSPSHPPLSALPLPLCLPQCQALLVLGDGGHGG